MHEDKQIIENHPLKLLCRYHHLKLYPDDDAGPPSMKKPVVVETYDEIVFSEPSEAFIQRVRNHPSAIINGSLSDLSPSAPGIDWRNTDVTVMGYYFLLLH